MKHFVTGTLIFLIASTSVWAIADVFTLQKAYAIIPVTVDSVGPVPGDLVGESIVDTDFQSTLIEGETASIAGTNAGILGFTGGSFNIDNFINGIFWAMAKAALQAITKSIVMWINSGFQGSPAFVTNLQAYLLATADHIAGTFISDLAGSTFMCSPFRLQITNLLQNQYFGSLFIGQCTLSGIVNNIQNFSISTNFGGSGGWPGWLTLTSAPQNNFFGAYYAASTELSFKLINARGQSISLLDWGHGFLSWCGSGNSGSTGNLTNLGSNQAVGQELNSVGVRAAPNGAQTCTNDDGTQGTVQTPGSVIESQLEFQLGTGVRQLELANSINEIIGALMQQLMTQVLGATGLFGLSSSPSGGGSSYTDQLGTTTQATESEVQGFQDQIQSYGQSLNTFITDWQKIGTAAQGAQSSLTSLGQTCPNDATSTQDILTNEVDPVVTQAGTEVSNAQAVFEPLSVIQSEGSTTDATQLGQAQVDFQTLQSQSTTPNTNDFNEATLESTNTGSTTPPSTYSHMVEIQNAANSAVPGCSALNPI